MKKFNSMISLTIAVFIGLIGSNSASSQTVDFVVGVVDYFGDMKIEIVDYFGDKRVCISGANNLDRKTLKLLGLIN